MRIRPQPVMCFRALPVGAKGSPSHGGQVILAFLVDSSSAQPPHTGARWCLVRKLMNITGQTAAEIFDSVRQLVHAGCLPPGEALPPVRQLASVLGVNRNTVASAYRRLVAAGVAVTRGRHGTLIRSSPQLPEHERRIHDALVHDLGSGNPAVQWLPDPIDALASAGYRPVLYGDAAIAPVLAQQGRAWFDADSPGDYQVQLTHGAVDALERLLGSGLTAGD